MHSYRFLAGVTLAILLGGTVSIVDVAVAGQRPDSATASAAGPSRLIAPALSESTLNSVASQPDAQGFNFGGGFQAGGFQSGGFNFGGGFQGGGFNFGGGFNLGGGFQGGGFNFGGGFQGGGGILTPFGWIPIPRVSAQAVPIAAQRAPVVILPPPPRPPLLLPLPLLLPPPLPLPLIPPWPLVVPESQDSDGQVTLVR
jgi:hypothetical protein